MKTQKYILASAVSFLMGAGGSGSVLAQDDGEEGLDWALEEIVVTATRRETSLNDTPISVAAIGGEEISRRNLTEMGDYLRTLPGLSFVERGAGAGVPVVRGLGLDPQNERGVSSAGVGVYLGDVSLSLQTADLKMIDLERVEVLRGPQGTLFGSGAMAGAVRNLPNGPDLNELEGSVKASYSNTADSGGDNNQLEGVINIPVIDDVLAVRAVAYRHDTSGYIDNIAGTRLATGGFISPGVPAAAAVAAFGGAELYQNEGDLGAVTHTGGRLSALWQPSDDLSVTLMHAYQDTEQDGQPYVELTTGDGYEQVTLQFGSGQGLAHGRQGLAGRKSGSENKINLTNLVVEYDLGWAALMSSSAWIEKDAVLGRDESLFGGFPVPFLLDSAGDSFSQELRLVSQLEGPIQYIVGAYYEEFDIDTLTSSWGSTDVIVVAFGAPFGVDSAVLQQDSFEQFTDQQAFYGELSYSFTEQLELTLGARRFDYERGTHAVSVGVLSNLDQRSTFEESGTSGKVNLSYTPNDDTLVYAQWAEGFRLGAPILPIDPVTCDVDNNGILDGTDAPITDGFDSDTTENIELGAKLALLDKRLQINAAIYHIDWQGIPISVFADSPTCFSSTFVNLGEARSRGVEIETTYYPTKDLRVSLGAAYNDAELTEDASSVGGVKGDRLPSSPDISANLGLQYKFELAGYSSYVAADYAYVDSFYNKVGEAGVKTGGYSEVNMSAGMSVNSVDVEFFVRNLTNEDALTHADTTLADDRAYQLRPRTMGINLTYNF